MIVGADTGPLNYLTLIDAVEVLPKLYGRILIPPSVRDELEDPRAPGGVRSWVVQSPVWLKTLPPTGGPDFPLISADLGKGERDAILLAQELDADELIIDDMRGRREAQRRQIHLTGTLGVLRIAAEQGLLDLKSAVDRLRLTNFHVSAEIVEWLFNPLNG